MWRSCGNRGRSFHKLFQVIDAVEPAVEELAVAGMEENDIGVMLAAKIEEMAEKAPFRDLANRGDAGNRGGADVSIDGDGAARGANGPLKEDAGYVDAVIHGAIEHRGINTLRQIIAAAGRPFAVVIDRSRLIQREIGDVDTGVIRRIDSKFCTSAAVPGDILTDHKGKVPIVARSVHALMAEDESERGWKVGFQGKG
jgi:hypothetical protein